MKTRMAVLRKDGQPWEVPPVFGEWSGTAVEVST